MRKLLLSCFTALALALAAAPARAVVTGTTTEVSYTGNDATTAYPFSFKATDKSWVKVSLDGVAQASGFTVTLNTNQDTAPGGTVTFAAAPASGVAVALRRVIPIEQRLVYRDGDRFPAKTTERGLDHAVMLAQQVDRRVADAETTHAADKAVQASKDASQDGAIAGGDAAERAYVNAMLGGIGAPEANAARITAQEMHTAGTVSVATHGAIANDGLDDTAAILAADAAAGSTRAVRFPRGTYHISAALAPSDRRTWIFEDATLKALPALTNAAMLTVRSDSNFLGALTLDGSSNVGVTGFRMGGAFGCQQTYVQRLEAKNATIGIHLYGQATKGVYLNHFGFVRARFSGVGMKLETAGGEPWEVNANSFDFASLQSNTTDALLVDGADGNRFGYLEAEQNVGDAIDLVRALGFYVAGGWVEDNGHNLRIANDPNVGGVFITARFDTTLTSSDTKFSITPSPNRQVMLTGVRDGAFWGRTRIAESLSIGTDGTAAAGQNVVRLFVAGGMDTYGLAAGDQNFYSRMQTAGGGYKWTADGKTLLDINATRAEFREDVVFTGTTGGAWNGAHPRLGSAHLWIGSGACAGKLMIKTTAAPTAECDGTVIGPP
jgi:hypothetical protein